MTTKEYLPVSRKDDKKCFGCILLKRLVYSYCCLALDKPIEIQLNTPPNCPLVKSIPEGNWRDGYEPSENTM